MQKSSNGIALSKGLTWVIGLSMPLIVLGLSGLVKLVLSLQTDIAVLKKDMTVAITVAIKNEDDIEKLKSLEGNSVIKDRIERLRDRVSKLEK